MRLAALVALAALAAASAQAPTLDIAVSVPAGLTTPAVYRVTWSCPSPTADCTAIELLFGDAMGLGPEAPTLAQWSVAGAGGTFNATLPPLPSCAAAFLLLAPADSPPTQAPLPVRDAWSVRNPRLALTGTAGEMRVVWTSSRAQPSSLQWSVDGSMWQTVAETGVPVTYTAADMCGAPATEYAFSMPGYTHDVVISGLSPATRYSYRLAVPGGGFSEALSFVSAPAAGAAASMLVFGDTGMTTVDTGMENVLPWPAYSSYPAAKQSFAMMARELAAAGASPLHALHIGDVSYARGYAYVWPFFMNQMSAVSASVSGYHVAVGNHELDWCPPQPAAEQQQVGPALRGASALTSAVEPATSNSTSNATVPNPPPFCPLWGNETYGSDSGGECAVPYYSLFHMPSPGDGSVSNATMAPARAPARNLYYSYDFGCVHVVVGSSETEFLPGTAQYVWLESELASVDRSATPWVIYAHHRPFRSSGVGTGGETAWQLANGLSPLLEQHGVDLGLFGHVHQYERTNALVGNTTVSSGGVVYVTVGNAGNNYQVPWASITANDFPIPSWLAFRTFMYGVGRVDATAESLKFTFKGEGGVVHDSVELLAANQAWRAAASMTLSEELASIM